MKRFVIVVLAAAILTSAAFGQLILGVSGNLYYMEDVEGNLPSISEAFDQFRDGTGVFGGIFGEIVGKKTGLGLAVNWNPPVDGYDGLLDVYHESIAQQTFDVNVYLSHHLFGGRFLIDPFINLGIGMMMQTYADVDSAWNYYNSYDFDTYIDSDDPLAGSLYWDIGIGLGLNLGAVGFFAKASINSIISDVLTGTYDDDANLYYFGGGNPGEEYTIPSLDPMPFKWTFGAKLIL